MSRNARHAPTLFIGLGGSGVKVIRWLRQAIYGGMTEAEREREPVAFLGIDFDPASNRANGRLESLGATEFRFYDPASIAATVNNIDREKPASQDVPPDVERWEFPEIREWYPDPDQTAIRYAQTEATGAAQWRPLGRVGYFLNDREIHDAIAEALAELDRRRGWSAMAGEHPNVVIVSSIAGGTGSSILFDVAVAVRKIGRGIAARAFLLLPELFAQIDFRDRVFPNAYATLWEVAALKNQHVVFHARYPRTPPVTRADSPPPFQRVFLVGPWIGERKPFSEPDDVYPFVAQMLRMSVTPEIRAAALSAEANASADSGAPLSDPTSLHVFCAMSAMAIRLLTYAELADLVMRQFLAELKPEGERPLLDILAPGRTAAPLGEILDWIETAASGQDEAFAVTQSYRSLELAKFMRERDSYRTLWRVSDLEKIRQDLRRFCGTDPAASMDEPPGLMDRIRTEFAQRLEERLQEWSAQHGDSPRALEGFLTQLERRLPERIKRKALPDLQNIDNFEQWLDTGRTWGSLAQQLTPARLERLHDEARRWFNTQPRDADYRLWVRQAIENAARDVIGHLRATEELRWSRVESLRNAAHALLAVEIDPIEERKEQIYLDGRKTSNVAEVLRRELARFDPAQVRAFHRALMAEFQSFYNDYREAEDTGAIQRWISATRRLFERQLATVAPGDVSTEASSYRLVSPESLFSDDEVTAAMLRCRNRVFQPGRVASPAALRIARLLVPQGFRDRGDYYGKMGNWSKGLLNAATSSLQANGSATENRIVVVIEDLFHPAEDIAGIYDYHAHYMQQDNRLLFHIHRQWPALFPPLITRAGDRTRVPCGNPGCPADIRLLSHAALFCPGCDQPIRNRCGNRDCLANDLADRPNREKFIESRTCPSCRGFLRTSWWSCPDHGDVPMDKPNCPHCVREGRPAVRISPRPDRLNRFTCPGCMGRNILPPLAATGKLARYLIDGVDGHDLLDAQNEFRTRLNRDAFCPQCAAQLAPVCPLRDPDHPERPHYLYRHRERGKIDRFRCYLHPAAEFFACGKCELPMAGGETRCHRCSEELKDCRFCTPLFGIRIPVSTDADARCPNCATRPRTIAALGDIETLSPTEPDELFCSNVFGCPAGGNLHDTTFPAHTKECPFCRSSELPLLRSFTREQHFRDCSFCRAVFNQQVSAETSTAPTGDCCLCGHAFADLPSFSGVELEQAEAIACVLRCTMDDERAFRLLLDRLGGQPLRATFEKFLAGIKRDPVKRVLAVRLDRILRIHDRQFGCRNEHPVRGGAGCDC